jgi:predicted PhzF superfamily epimerase YddE/YHI9
VTGLHVLRVFVGPDERAGNPLGVFLDGDAIPADRRQAVAAELGFSETIFIDDRVLGTCQIFTPAAELPFAGHPSVGAAWLLRESGTPVEVLRPPAGDVPVRHDADRTWIRARTDWVDFFTIQQLASAEEVEALRPPPMGTPGTYVWAWLDEAAGVVRSRSFPTDLGIAEDEATGIAAVAMGGLLGRPLTIRQGVGSEILVRPVDDETVEIGGRVETVETREFAAA